MASGPQHYDAAQDYLSDAEELIAKARAKRLPMGPVMEIAQPFLDIAAVHAQLAAVAVHHDFSEAHKYVPNAQEWKKILEDSE